MKLPEKYRAWIIDHYLENDLDGRELRLESRPLKPLDDGELLMQTQLLSIDASNLLWLSKKKDYLPQLEVGDIMRGNIISRVIASKHAKFEVGETIMALQGWTDYSVVNGDALLAQDTTLRIRPHPDVPLDAYIGTLGITGWSAYIGLSQIGKLTPDDTVLISGAAGATGMMATQIANATGATVYGIAGGTKKCQFLVDELQLDGAIDYRAATDLKAEIDRVIPDGVDVFFDNVGGEILDAVLPCMRMYGRIVASGSVSQYGQTVPYGIKNLPLLTTRRLRMEGFLVLDYLGKV